MVIQQMQTIPDHCCARLIIVRSTHKFEPKPSLNGWSHGIKRYCIVVPLNDITSLQNVMKIYHQKISTYPSYLKPAKPLGRFCPTVNNYL